MAAKSRKEKDPRKSGRFLESDPVKHAYSSGPWTSSLIRVKALFYFSFRRSSHTFSLRSKRQPERKKVVAVVVSSRNFSSGAEGDRNQRSGGPCEFECASGIFKRPYTR